MEQGEAARAKNIVVLGGSFGGLGSVHYLLRHVIQDFPHHRIVLISPNSDFLWRPGCPRAACRQVYAEDKRLLVKISDILKQYPAELFQLTQGTATSVDCNSRSVRVSLSNGGEETWQFDALVIATGASTTSPLLGLTEHGLVQDSWKLFRQVLDSAEQIVIAGGGPAGIELAGELGELLNGQKSAGKPRSTITVVTAGSQILPHLRPAIAETAERALADFGVKIIKNTRIDTVRPENAGTGPALTTKATLHLDNGSTLSADLYIPATGTKPNSAFMDKAVLGPDGRVKVNTSTLRVECSAPRIYAVGDVSTFARPAIHSILDAVPVLCTNLKRDLLAVVRGTESSAGEDRQFTEDSRETQIVPIGSHRGVGAAMGWRLPSFLVSWIKGKSYLLWAASGVTRGKQWAKA